MPVSNEGRREFVKDSFPVGHVGNTSAARWESTPNTFCSTRVFNWCPSLPPVMNNLKLAAGKATSTAKFSNASKTLSGAEKKNAECEDGGKLTWTRSIYNDLVLVNPSSRIILKDFQF